MKMSMTKPLTGWNGKEIAVTDQFGNPDPDGKLFTLRDTITQCIDRIPPQADAGAKGKAGALAVRLWAGDTLDFDPATKDQITELVTAYAPVLGQTRVLAELAAAEDAEKRGADASLPQAADDVVTDAG